MRNAHLKGWSLMAEISVGTSGSLYLSLWCVSQGAGLSCHLLSLLCPPAPAQTTQLRGSPEGTMQERDLLG